MASTVALPPLERNATFRPRSADAESRTVELVWSTGATVRRRGFLAGEWDESLDLDGARLDRLNSGAALLDSHRGTGLRNVLGVVERAEISGAPGQRIGRAIVRFSRRPEAEEVFRDVVDGVIRGVSVGYQLHRVERQERDNDVPLVTARDWEPFELSLVAVPADAGAQVRAQAETTPCLVMESANMSVLVDASGAPIGTAALTPPAAAPSTDSAVRAERDRIARLQLAGKVLGLPDQAQRMVSDGIAADSGISVLMSAAGERALATATISGGADYTDPVSIRTRMADALSARISGERPPAHAGEYANLSLIGMADALAQARGERFDRSDTSWLFRASGPGYHSTSDFATLLVDAQNKSLRRAYEAEPSGIRVAARQTTANDFRNIHRLNSGEFPLPERISEHGEFTRGSMGQSDEVYRLDTFGRVFTVTRQVLVNDDMGVFQGLNQKMATATAEFVARALADRVVANPVMSDGTVVFHANHGNVQIVAGPPNVTTIGNARAAMRKQLGLDGQVYVRADPRYIIVPPDLETIAEQSVAQITAAIAEEVNPFAGRLVVVVEPRLPNGFWYLAADPSQADGLEYAYLNGAEGPQIESRIGFDIDGVEVRLRLDFGSGWIDYRGWQKTVAA